MMKSTDGTPIEEPCGKADVLQRQIDARAGADLTSVLPKPPFQKYRLSARCGHARLAPNIEFEQRGEQTWRTLIST
ncbi:MULTISPECIES: hypothetical protein [Herbaspirillum]|uniref:hypothetical protein n=1 Tax=Herbaspirillum TaxID=963 RepID=UPI0011D1AAA2|nr:MULTISPECIES: hypothetical protein [Herbaspirillum]